MSDNTRYNIPIYKPHVSEKILESAHSAIDSAWLSKGMYNSTAKGHIERVLDAKNIALIANGSCAMHLAMLALREVTDKRKLTVSNNVYIAAYNAALIAGFELDPIDADEETWNMDLSKINPDQPLLVVHNLGNIVHVPKLLGKHPKLMVVEDACEGIFGKYGDSFAGTKSIAGAYSFFGNKNVTTGEGGAICVPDKELFEHVVNLHDQGGGDAVYLHRQLGYNYRMNNVQAALLDGQLRWGLDHILARKKYIFNYYKEALSEISNVSFQKVEDDTEHARWMFGVRVHGRDYSARFFKARKIETRPMFFPINAHSFLSHIKTETKVAQKLHEECFMIPSFPDLTDRDMDWVIQHIKGFANGQEQSQHCNIDQQTFL
jgi:perosamine synthetase